MQVNIKSWKIVNMNSVATYLLSLLVLQAHYTYLMCLVVIFGGKLLGKTNDMTSPNRKGDKTRGNDALIVFKYVCFFSFNQSAWFLKTDRLCRASVRSCRSSLRSQRWWAGLKTRLRGPAPGCWCVETPLTRCWGSSFSRMPSLKVQAVKRKSGKMP